MALFDSVSREQYNLALERAARAESELATERERYERLVSQVIDIKRHEHGMNPQNFDPATLDPAYGLGPKTLAALDEFSNGDAEIRRFLVVAAWQEWNKNHQISDLGERDALVAELILAGDQG